MAGRKTTSHGCVCLSGLKMRVDKIDAGFSFAGLKCANRDAINVVAIEMPLG